jgi:hypothetical protein
VGGKPVPPNLAALCLRWGQEATLAAFRLIESWPNLDCGECDVLPARDFDEFWNRVSPAH